MVLNSENRDEPWALSLFSQAESVEAVFGRLATRDDGALERELAKLRLDAPPDHFGLERPSRTATALANFLAYEALSRLGAAMDAAGGGAYTYGGHWRLAPTAKVSRDGASKGIPLLASFSPPSVPAHQNALDVIPRWLVFRRLPRTAQVHDDFAARLARVLAVEHELWRLAGEAGLLTSRIPYAFRVLGIQWFWSAAAHGAGLEAPALCARCGDLFWPRRRIKPPPRCARCAKEAPAARSGPRHAIAPDGPGEWWLECATGCGNLFLGPAQARRCEDCRASRISPGKRHSFRVAENSNRNYEPGTG